MPAGPTFASGPIEPGTYVKVDYAQRPPASPPPFISSLIGRTSIDKPVASTLVRNQVAGQTVAFNPTTNVTTAVTGADPDETIRRDLLLADNTGLEAIGATPIVDNETSTQFPYADPLTTPAFNGDWAVTDVGVKSYIEWLIDYTVKTATPPGTAPIFIGGAGVGNMVQLARASGDPIFAADPGPVTIPDGVYTFRMSVSGTMTIFTLKMTLKSLAAFSAGVVVTGPTPTEFTITDSGAGGSNGVVKVKVDPTQFGTFTADGDYDNEVTVVTSGPRAGTGVSVATIQDIQALGCRYVVNYQAMKTLSDFVPQRFDNLADVQSAHGMVGVSTPNDHLSVGAEVYFNEGGQSVWIVPLKDAVILGSTDGFDLDEPTGSGYVAAVKAALVQLENVAEVSMVVPLSPTEAIGSGNFRPGILNAVLSHVNKMSAVSEAKPRMAMLGALAGTTLETVFTGTAAMANSNRIVYMAPSAALLSINGATRIVDGSIIAADLAGILSSGVNAGESISGKQLTSFIDVPDPFTRTQKNRIGETYGVTIIEKKSGTPTVRHFLTTNPSSSLMVEAKVTIIAIDVSRSLKGALDATVINTRLIGSQTTGLVRKMVGAILDQKITAQIITAFDIVKVEQDPDEPRQLNVEVGVIPVLDTNWIYIHCVFQTG
jgi:hypothetical protein